MHLRTKPKCIYQICIVLALTSLCVGQIHRAKQLKSKTDPGTLTRFPPGAFSDFDHEAVFKTPEEVDNSQVISGGHSRETWIYSLISAMLVGLSGVFPLLVIPLEAGKALQHGAPAAKLKLLLSFAVGGLLGDVFLHLLPEAWAHLDKDGHDHQGHLEVGLWVLAGIFCFLIIEKAFPNAHHNDDDDDDEISEKQEEEQVHNNVEHTSKSNKYSDDHTTQITTRSRSKKGMQTSLNGSANGGLANGHVTQNGKMNGHNGNGVINGRSPIRDDKQTEKQEIKQQEDSHIKTSGWLNLMANIIDNFTHGLAVAGSYCISTKTGLITTAAVLLHEIPHEVGDFAILLQSGFDRWKAAKAQLLTATGGLMGAITALSAESAQAAGDRTAWILPFTSGGFIYIALVTVVPDLLKEQNVWNSAKQIFLLLLGIVLVAGITFLCE